MKPIGMCPPEKRVEDLTKDLEDMIVALKKLKVPYIPEDIMFVRNLGRYLHGACLFTGQAMQTVHESSTINPKP